MPTLNSPTPTDLLHRWDRQQGAYIAGREERFETMLRVLELTGGPSPTVLDLASGPGSLTERVLHRFPQATVVATDKDPVLLAIARDTVGTSDRVTVVDSDLTDPRWADGFRAPTFDAVLTSTALHWLSPGDLAQLYLALADLLPRGAVFMNADHLRYDTIATPGLAAIAAADDEDVQAQTFAAGADTWDLWWSAAEALPGYDSAVRERQQRWAGKNAAPRQVTLGFHLAALQSAGFSEVSTVWQRLDDYIVYARR
jgi:hypothetical protein